jgi:hypothetical protein
VKQGGSARQSSMLGSFCPRYFAVITATFDEFHIDLPRRSVQSDGYHILAEFLPQ